MKKIVAFAMAVLCLSSFSFGQRTIQKAGRNVAHLSRNVQRAAASSRQLGAYMQAVQQAEKETRDSYNSIANTLDLISWPAQEEKLMRERPTFYKNSQYPRLNSALRNSRWNNYFLAFEAQYMTPEDLTVVEDFLTADPYNSDYVYNTGSYRLGIAFSVSTVNIRLQTGGWMVQVDPFVKRLRVWRYDVRATGSGRAETYVSAK